MRWTHDALKPHYRGWNGTSADHNYNWWDAIHSGGGLCGPSSQEPCDDNGRGSHTTGTSIGDDGSGNQIGVAPGAKWIRTCRNMDQGVGTPATYTECFEFFMAPLGSRPFRALTWRFGRMWSTTAGSAGRTKAVRSDTLVHGC